MQHVEDAGSAAVVEHRDGAGSLPGGDVEEGAGGGGAVVLGDPSGQEAAWASRPCQRMTLGVMYPHSAPC